MRLEQEASERTPGEPVICVRWQLEPGGAFDWKLLRLRQVRRVSSVQRMRSGCVESETWPPVVKLAQAKRGSVTGIAGGGTMQGKPRA